MLVGRQEGYLIRKKTSAPKHPGTAVNVCWWGVRLLHNSNIPRLQLKLCNCQWYQNSENDKVQSTLNGLSPHHTCHLLAGIFAEAVPGEHRQFWRLLDLAPMWSTVMSNPTWLLQSKKYED